MNLFVLGNGFDICHSIDSKYEHFRKWLIDNFCLDLNKNYYPDIPYYETNYKYLEEYDEAGFARLLVYLVNKATKDKDLSWSDFEDALSRLPWEDVLDNVFYEYDKEGSFRYDWTSDAYAEKINYAKESCHIINVLFAKWAREIDITKAIKKEKFSIFTNNDLYLSFNYTSTLEEVYGIKDVCHIHGYTKDFSELIVGHGEDIYINNNHNEIYDSAYCVINDIFNLFKKDTKKCINKNEDFFKRIVDVDCIYVFGKSIGKPDIAYFKYVYRIAPDSKIRINIYKSEEKDININVLREIGFKDVEEWIV